MEPGSISHKHSIINLSDPISNSGLVSLLEVRTDWATDTIQKLKLIIVEIELNTTSNHPYHEYAILSPSLLRAGTRAWNELDL